MQNAIDSQVQSIVQDLASMPKTDKRQLIAIAGAPGSGKSTLGAALVDGLVSAGLRAALLPMDGFHLDDRILEQMGLLPRKGSPESFDFDGFFHMLSRAKTQDTVYYPIFDRSREIAIAAAGQIQPETDILVVEGNYLLFNEAPWNTLPELWDYSVYLDVPTAELERRLIDRWLSFGFDPAAAKSKATSNDLPNAYRVVDALIPADKTLIFNA